MSALGNSEASAPQRFKCIGIMGSSNEAAQLSALGAVSSLWRVRFRRFYCILSTTVLSDRDGITYNFHIVSVVTFPECTTLSL